MKNAPSRARKRKKKSHGGARKYIPFAALEEQVLRDGAVKECLEFECQCEYHCLWQVSNQVPDAKEKIRRMRKLRFTGLCVPGVKLASVHGF